MDFLERLLKSMYDRVVSAVKVKSGLTATFTVRQGSNLSPTLFNIQWNSVNTTTFGPWKFVRINGVVVLTG